MTSKRCPACGGPLTSGTEELCLACAARRTGTDPALAEPTAEFRRDDLVGPPTTTNRLFRAAAEPLTQDLSAGDGNLEFSPASPASGADGVVTPDLSRADQDTVQFAGPARATGERAACELVLPRQLGEYQLIQEIGRGGMGIVYKATQDGVERPVAVKTIIAGRLASPNDIERFYQEARAAGKLRHPHIVQVHQAGELEGQHFFSMDFIEGKNLATLAHLGQLGFTQIAVILRKITEAIQFAHSKGVLHRDLKPQNVLVDANGEPHVSDFGLAKDIHADSQITTEGSALGTPSYMSPEQAQARHGELDARTDVYSLGAVLYELLTRRPPFKGDSPIETIMMVVQQRPVPPRAINKDCPRDLEAICLKCLEKDPPARYQSAQELAGDLQRFLNQQPVAARHTKLLERAAYWLRDVPVVAAVIGRKVAHPTTWHYRAQWLAILLLIGLVMIGMARPNFTETLRLHTIDIATGPEGGTYAKLGEQLNHALGTCLSRDTRTHHSAGAVESRLALLTGDVDLAFLQENTLNSPHVQVIAPLYYEVVLILVRRDSAIHQLQDLAEHRIALGAVGSGMRLSAEELLERMGIDAARLRDTERGFADLLADSTLDGAIVTSKLDDSRVIQMLVSKQFRIVPIRQAERIPGFRAYTIDRDELPGEAQPLIPEDGLTTAATFAVLAVRDAAPAWFVEACLRALYVSGQVGPGGQGLFTPSEAAAWSDLSLHPAAREYFRRAAP